MSDRKEWSIPDGFKLQKFDVGFLEDAGPYYTKRSDTGYLVATRVRGRHVNGWDIAHGGVLATLADVSLSYQVFRASRPPQPLSTVNLTTNFLAGAKIGDWLVAQCEIDRVGSSIAYVRGEIRNGDKIAMTMSAVFKLLKRARDR